MMQTHCPEPHGTRKEPSSVQFSTQFSFPLSDPPSQEQDPTNGKITFVYR